ncbi:hypothetical protein [Plebeiibacterium marinum]|uniref:Uncharacterized protein n=1 Tax=Plebeiibacterium marinum TaxID=2992111 RepID=A0AAE3MF92_9BACT|nr:hypothetical protein [Plebeiobacterium marinum]MCW3806779.1 hypothetical protein [Plebeiobacterium marinum]
MEKAQGVFDLRYIFSFVDWLKDSGKSHFEVCDYSTNSGFINLNYPEEFKVGEIGFHYDLLSKLNELFPSCMASVYLPVQIENHILNRWKVYRSNVPYTINENGKFEFKAFSFFPLAFYLQLATVFIEKWGFIKDSSEWNSFKEFYEDYKYAQGSIIILGLSTPRQKSYLVEHLGKTYSRGELMDFVDRLFDQYKHTHIAIELFRNIFACFGQDIECVGNMAFDNYMESRNTVVAWNRAIVEHLMSKFHFSLCFSNKIANIILK